MAGKIWPGIVIACVATAFMLLLLVLIVTANAPVYAASDEPIADFNAGPSSGDVPLTMYFSYIPIQAGIIEWSWDFGDGETSNGQTTSHTYANPGQYVVTLTVKDRSGLQGFATKQITVYSEGSGKYAGPPAPVETIVTPNPGSVSIIPGTIDTPRPPSGTAVPAKVTPHPTAVASGIMSLGGITLSEDALQLIIAGAIAVVIAATIIYFFSNMSKLPRGKEAEKPAAKPPARPGKPKVKDRASRPVKKSEDISQDYIYGLVTGKVESEAELPGARQQNDYKK
jgi:PKD repeat protein